MCHPLYPVARRLVGRPVHVFHVSGRTYSGTLHSVTPGGIYLMHSAYGVSFRDDAQDGLHLDHAVVGANDSSPTSHVYSPLGYFAFGALTGLTIGALASPYW